MTGRPYTDADLRAEAAAQHANLLRDPDFMGIGERMEGEAIPSRPDDDWDDLDREDFDAAQRAIDDLLTRAADLSDWAVNLGADGLHADGRHLTLGPDDAPIVRVHLAFHPDLPQEARDRVHDALGAALLNAL